MFSQKNRLNTFLFNKTFQKGKPFFSEMFFVKAFFIKSPTKFVKTSVVISKKYSKKAVTRNYLKRQITTYLQEKLPLLSFNNSLQLIFFLNKKIKADNPPDIYKIRQNIDFILRKITSSIK